MTPRFVVAQRRRWAGRDADRSVSLPDTEIAEDCHFALGIDPRAGCRAGRHAVTAPVAEVLVDHAEPQATGLPVVEIGHEERSEYAGGDARWRKLLASDADSAGTLVTGVGEPLPVDPSSLFGAAIDVEPSHLGPNPARVMQGRTDELTAPTAHAER